MVPRSRLTTLLGACVLLGLLAAMPAAGRAQTLGPVSTYFLTAGDQQKVHAIQGSSVVASFSTAGTGREYPLFVLNDSIVTVGPSTSETGRTYTFSGVASGSATTYPVANGSAWDATTDGTYAYFVDYSLGTVYRTDLDFSNPVALFGNLGGGAFLGITYDASNNSLWLSGWSSNVVRNYSLAGTLLSSFTGPTSSLTSLALDPATGTLWMGSQQQQGNFWEYSRTGALLQSINLPSLANQNTLGGEFALAAVPEPATWIQLAAGALLLALGARRRTRER